MPSTRTHLCASSLSSLSRQQFWQQHIDQWRKSAVSKSAYCRDRDLIYHQFIYWHKRLGSSSRDGQRPDVPTGRFLPVAIAAQDSPHSAGLRLKLPGGQQIEGIDARSVQWVGALIAQL